MCDAVALELGVDLFDFGKERHKNAVRQPQLTVFDSSATLEE
jgi:hypothetical protein